MVTYCVYGLVLKHRVLKILEEFLDNKFSFFFLISVLLRYS